MTYFEIFNSCKEKFPEIKYWPRYYVPKEASTECDYTNAVFGLEGNRNCSIGYIFPYSTNNMLQFLADHNQISEIFVVRKCENDSCEIPWTCNIKGSAGRIYFNAATIKYIKIWNQIQAGCWNEETRIQYAHISDRINQILKDSCAGW